MSPDAQAVRSFLERARRRALVLRAIRTAAIAMLGSAIAFALLGQSVSIGVGLTVAAGITVLAAILAVVWSPPTTTDIALAVERKTPDSRNLVLTAAELVLGRVAATPPITLRILEDSRRIIDRVDLGRILPATQTIGVVIAALALSSAAVIARHTGVTARLPHASVDSASLSEVTIEVLPPEYSGRPSVRLRDPQRVDALAASRIRINIAANAASIKLETVTSTVAMQVDAQGRFSAEILADADGYIALAPATASGATGERRLIGLSVTPDATPKVRVTAPGRDLMIADGQRTLPLALSADDDLGLATLRVRYTRVSGSGENFSFTEGEVPLTLTKPSAREWAAAGQWPLAALKLEPGDMLIYRGIATDHRPGAPAGESDAFIVEVAAPGAASLDGFAIDDREDRYALSQQMVIVKTERLLARRASMPADEVQAAALDLAAEQRQVRAEFVFMMGGELADAGIDLNSLSEEAEAEGEDDLAAGRLANQGRLDIMRAIRSMSRAAARLADGNATAALPLEKEALAFLQRAFSKSRYILRTLGSRERLDLSRRLTGVLAALGRDNRPAAEAPLNPRATALRGILADTASLPDDPPAGRAAEVSLLAQRLLRIDPAAAAIKEAADKLAALAAAISGGRGRMEIRQLRDAAASAIAMLVRTELPAGAEPAGPPALADLSGALAEALRAGARKR